MSSPALQESEIDYRPAAAAESRDIAQLVCLAGGGIYEFLFDDFIPFLTVADILSMGIAHEGNPLSFRNCFVAVDKSKERIAGLANAFPANDLKGQSYWILPAERQEHVRSFLQCQDWGSMFLNALGVRAEYSGRGIGTRLLDWARRRAVAAGLQRLSLHVWADNVTALRFYKARGFTEVDVAVIADHPRLHHTGGSILMSRLIADDEIASAPDL